MLELFELIWKVGWYVVSMVFLRLTKRFLRSAFPMLSCGFCCNSMHAFWHWQGTQNGTRPLSPPHWILEEPQTRSDQLGQSWLFGSCSELCGIVVRQWNFGLQLVRATSFVWLGRVWHMFWHSLRWFWQQITEQVCFWDIVQLRFRCRYVFDCHSYVASISLSSSSL